jgi:hypothetical protein
MAGQSVGLVTRLQPIAAILDELVEQTMGALMRDEWQAAPCGEVA